jgi:plastocyanin
MKFARIIAATACVFAFLPALPLSAATRDVDIPGRFFQPQRTSIVVGSTVRWANSSSERHSVRAMSGSSEQFASSDNCRGALLFNDCIRPGGAFSHTFSQRGTIFYYCELHGSDAPFPNCGMCGRIAVVRQSSGTIAPVTPGSSSPTATARSPSPSPDQTGSPSPSPGSISTSPIAAPGDSDGSPNIVAIAAVAVVLLGGSGYLIYRTMIR